MVRNFIAKNLTSRFYKLSLKMLSKSNLATSIATAVTCYDFSKIMCIELALQGAESSVVKMKLSRLRKYFKETKFQDSYGTNQFKQ